MAGMSREDNEYQDCAACLSASESCHSTICTRFVDKRYRRLINVFLGAEHFAQKKAGGYAPPKPDRNSKTAKDTRSSSFSAKRKPPKIVSG